MQSDVQVLPHHVDALAGLPTKKAKVEYACEQVPAVQTDVVRQWLEAHGVQASPKYLSTIVKSYRSPRNMTDTGEIEPLTAAALAKLADRPDTAPVGGQVAGREAAAAPEVGRTGDTPAGDADAARRTDPVGVATPARATSPVAGATTAGTAPDTDAGTATPAAPPAKPFPRWPLVILAAGAFVAVWSGWVGIGRLTGFGLVNLLPGIVADGKWSTIDTAITLPLGVEAYGAFALAAFLSGRIPKRARRFAGWSATGSLLVGAAGQAAYHLLVSHPAWLNHNPDGTMSAPTPIVVLVSSLPVAVLGMGAALAHMVRET